MDLISKSAGIYRFKQDLTDTGLAVIAMLLNRLYCGCENQKRPIVSPLLPDEQWNEISLVKYLSFVAFRNLIESPQYLPEADFHRRTAL